MSDEFDGGGVDIAGPAGGAGGGQEQQQSDRAEITGENNNYPNGTSQHVSFDGSSPPHPYDRPPQSWPHEKHDSWARLSPEDREFLHRRETEAHSKISELGTHARTAQSFEGVTNAHRDFIPQGVEPHEAFDLLMHAHRALQTDPVRAMTHLAQQYGIDLHSLAGGQQDSGEQFQQHLNQALQARDDEWRQFLQARDTEAAQAQKAEADRQTQEARERADRAKRSAEINVKGDQVNSASPKSWDDTIAETARRLYGGGR